MHYPTMTIWSLFGCLAILAGTAWAAYERPPYVLPCRRNDPEINKCIKNSFNHIRPYISRGLTELRTPPLEPLRIEELAMENNAGAVRIKALFTDIVANGAGNYTIKDVRSDVKKLRIDMSLGIPRVETRGKYEIIGNVLLLPVRSNGEFWTEFSDISAIAKIFGKPTERDGEMFMSVEKMLVDFTMKNARFKVKDHVNTQSVLGEAINQFLNQNANELIQEMRPAASQSIAKLFRKFLNDAFSNIPMRLWLLED
ncbi:circadian clock-controlled protein daywake-like [Wyeomyia smithii]|uniref:circadian clock-controlled protein daywake-like n=1 Tax=Wyeomyia smithii TaxID=174621 RepID=UPI002467D031|nr:circadian clock-controlled protein daywake-like [Wyeomyia smithii]XP_055548194.1 circadian clock-controlled protein daywake-like [Wyeomyia smithii]XP_055548195.1 circadian clock-controlled protein daywake-like [Wyeomyia smithii]